MPVMTPLVRATGRAIGRRKLAASVGAVLVLAFTGSGGSGVGVASSAPDAILDAPSIQYQEAMAHADKAYSFVPGGAVTVPYTPRAGDQTVIDGSPAQPLPAGSATGVAIAASPQGATWAAGETDPPSNGSDKQVAAAPFKQPLTDAKPAATNALRREVYGFLPYWTIGSSINYDVISTIAYFGIDLNTDGSLNKTGNGWNGWTSSGLTTVINAAHAKHVRVVLTIEAFAWTGSGGGAAMTTLLSSAANRTNAVKQIAAAVRDRGVDGVNLDFEPIASGQSANYVTFVRQLRAQLDSIHAGYELTFCGTGRTTSYDVTNLLAAGAADNVFIMGYDLRDGGSAYAASHDPLTSPRVFDLTDSVDQYRALAPASKILLGLPYYGIAYSTPDTTIYSTNRSGTTYGDATWVPYYTAAALALTNLKQYDSVEESAWVSYYGTYGGVGTWRELYYNDARALAARYERINYWGLGGVGIWVLGYDSGYPELNQALADNFLTDHNPPKAGIVNVTPTQASESFTVSWKGSDDWNGVKNYDLQVSTDGGTWTDWITGTTATSSSFDGASGHNYSFRVRATDGVGNVSAWDVTTTYTAAPTLAVNGYLQVVSGSMAERGQPTITSNPLFTVASGTIFQIIGGPVSADGYHWYQVNGPITESNPVTPTFPGCWVAVDNGTTAFASAITPPNTTSVTAGINSLVIGTPSTTPSGSGVDAGRTFSPDGDGIKDKLGIAWTNEKPYTGMTLSVYRADGTVAGTIGLGSQTAGAQKYTWDGTLDGKTPLPDSQYILQIAGTSGSTRDYAPSPAPFDAAAFANFGVIIDTTPSGTYTPITPVRIVDTRINLRVGGPFVNGKARTFSVANQNGIPANAMAVTGNVTITSATGSGYLRVGPAATGTYSTINFVKGDTRANGVTVGLAPDGSLSALFVSSTSSATVQVIFDLTGYFARDAAGATFVPIAPTRLVDTRIKLGLQSPVAANTVSTFMVGGTGNIPANATAVVGNATVTGQGSGGYLTVAPSIGSGGPATSTVNFPVGDTRANNVVLPLNAGNLQVTFKGTTRTSVQFIFDATGYFVPGLSGATYVPLNPSRVVDSRVAQGLPGPLKALTAGQYTVRGHASVPLSAVAVVGNLTVTGQTAAGWLAVTPTPIVTTSNLNFPYGDARANGFTCALGAGGTLAITYGARGSPTTQVVVDIVGYYR
ncbi:MAG TPA: glycosyl hydrolase family 18 protein [Candidatus Limnocylindrales bacterium]